MILDGIVEAGRGGEGWGAVGWLVLLEFAIAAANDALARAISLTESLLGDRFANRTSLRLMEHAGRLDMAYFDDPEFYDKLERARRQTTGRIGLLAGLAGLVQELLTLITLAAGVIWFSPWLFLLLAVTVAPAFLGETHFAAMAYSLLYKWTPQRRELDYLRLLGASLQSVKEVKIFGLEPFLAERYRRLSDRYYAENSRLAIRRAAAGTGLNLIGTAGYYAAYAWIVHQAIRGVITIGDLTFLAGAFSRSRTILEQVFAAASGIADQALHLNDLFDFLATEPRMEGRSGGLVAPRAMRAGFEFRNVSFSYPGSSRPVLRNLSFRIEPEQRIALIGENGAGKTSLVKLLARLYDPTEGQILLEGVDLREYDVRSLRSAIGVIFQDYMKYDMLVRENIGLGRVEHLEDEARIRDSAAKSLADADVGRLPRGFDQMLGRRFEGGVELSAGQWQKIALARAYMRDAQVLILDEPTASLDARAEYEIFLRFAELTRGRTAILISHRFSTVRMADQILVIENGSIRERGTHRELLEYGGRYAELFELQAAGYR